MTRGQRRARIVGLGLAALVVVVAIGALLTVVTGAGSSGTPRRTTWTRPRPRASSTRSKGLMTSSVAASRSSTATRRPPGPLPGRRDRPRRPVPERESGGWRPAVHGGEPARGTDRTGVTGAYPIDIDGDGHHRPRGAPTTARTSCCAASAIAASSAPTRLWGFDGGDAWTTAFSATWEGPDDAADAGFRQLRRRAADPSTVACCATTPCSGPPSTRRPAMPRPSPLTPVWCTLSMLFSDWDRSGRRDLRVSNDRHYYGETRRQEQLWRIAPGEPPRLYTAADGWRRCRSGAWASPATTSLATAIPRSSSRARPTTSCRPSRRSRPAPTYRDIALDARRHRDAALRRRHALPSTAWHAEFQDVNNDGLVDLFIAKGNVSTMADYAMKDPSNLLIGQPDGTFLEGAEAAGIVHFGQGRGAALADLNLDGMPDLVERATTGTPGSGGTSGPAMPPRPRPMGDWLGLRLEQPGANHDAIGVVDRGQERRPGPASRAHGRGRPRGRTARVDPRRARVGGRRRRSAYSGPTARSARGCRSRRTGSPSSNEGLTRHDRGNHRRDAGDRAAPPAPPGPSRSARARTRSSCRASAIRGCTSRR